VVLDGVFSASLKNLSDLGPLIAMGFLEDVQDDVFFKAPLGLLNFRVKMVVPSLPALFANFPG